MKEVGWPSIVDDGTGPRAAPIYQMAKGMAIVPDEFLEATIEAAEECPGECIFVQVDDD